MVYEYNLKLEFSKIQNAFERVKKDNDYLLKRIEDLEKSNRKLLKSISEINTNNVVSTKIIDNTEKKIYIGNKDSKKVHISDCPYAKKINLENREIFDKINDAIKEKYKRCSCVS